MLSDLIDPPKEGAVLGANTKKLKDDEAKSYEAKIRKEREGKINRLLAFLKRQKSPVANYEIASLVVNDSEAAGADYRVVIAISGVESGFCRASFSYNCFGYLNGKHYSSFIQAFSDIVPRVARQYAARYGWNFEALAKAYGQHEWQRTSSNMRYFANQI